MLNNKISIITVCYNAENVIRDTMLSVLNQTYDDLEYIVIDGNSTDNTCLIIREIVESYPYKNIFTISESDEGLYDAMNKGIKLASGEWIGIMNAGDAYPNKDSLSDFFSTDFSIYDVVYGDSLIRIGNKLQLIRGKDCYSKLRYTPIYRHGASFVKRKVHLDYLFDIYKKKFEFALDYDMIFRLYLSGAKFKYINKQILVYEQEGLSNHPWKGVWLRFLISSQYGNYVKPFIWMLYSYFVQLLKTILFVSVQKRRID